MDYYDELLTVIMSFLKVKENKKNRLVSSSWNRVYFLLINRVAVKRFPSDGLPEYLCKFNHIRDLSFYFPIPLCSANSITIQMETIANLPSLHGLSSLSIHSNTIPVPISFLSDTALSCTGRLLSVVLANPTVSDHHLPAMLRRCGPSLRSLHIQDTDHVTSISLHSVGRYCSRLENLSLPFCMRVTSIASAAIHLQHLHSLNLQHVPITDQDLNILSQNMHLLSRFHVSNNSHISDHGMRSLCNGCPRLQTLQVVSCRNITGETVHHVMQTLPHLDTLVMHGCHILTQEASELMVILRELLPHARRISLVQPSTTDTMLF